MSQLASMLKLCGMVKNVWDTTTQIVFAESPKKNINFGSFSNKNTKNVYGQNAKEFLNV